MLLLVELLDTPNFGKSVDSLAADFRREHGLPSIRELGIVVPGVDAAGLILGFITWHIRGRAFVPPPGFARDSAALERLLANRRTAE